MLSSPVAIRAVQHVGHPRASLSSSCLALILVVLLLSDTQRGEQINRAETPSTHSPTVSQSHYAFPASAPHPRSSIALPSPPTCRSPSRNLPFAGRRR